MIELKDFNVSPSKKCKEGPYIVSEKQLTYLKDTLDIHFQIEKEKLRNLVQRITENINFAKSKSFRVKKENLDDITFWIIFNNDGNELQIQINIPNTVLYKGTYKRIKSGLVILMPSLNMKEIVRLRPTAITEWSDDALSGFDLHKLIYEKIHNPDKGIRIAVPPYQRVEFDEDEKEDFVSIEYVQDRYPSTFLEHRLGLFNMLEICKDLFCTIEAVHNIGYIHRDVKPINILLDTNSKMHLNDFDLCTDKFHTTANSYLFWDIATQKGFSNPYCDMVGGAICLINSLEALHSSKANCHLFITHEELKKANAVESIMSKLILKGEEEDVFRHVIALACVVIQAEDRVFSRILSSMVQHFLNLTLPYKIPPIELDKEGPFKGTSFTIVTYGLSIWAVKKFNNQRICLKDGTSLATFLDQQDCPLDLANGREILRILTSFLIPDKKIIETPLSMMLKDFLSKATDESKELLHDITFDFTHILKLLCQPEIQKMINLDLGTSELYLQLSSPRHEEKVKGFATLASEFPSPRDVQKSLKKIMESIHRL